MTDQNTVLVGTDWTELTTADTAKLTFQVLRGDCYIRGTETAVPPVARHGLLYTPGAGEDDVPLTDLFPGIAARRVWARANWGNSAVTVSHAPIAFHEQGRGAELTFPATRHFAIAPDDSADLAAVPRAIYVGVGGDVAMQLVDDPGVTVTYSNMLSGVVYPCRPVRILATGTTATGLVGWP